MHTDERLWKGLTCRAGTIFGEQVPSIFLVKFLAAILEFYNGGGLERGEKCMKGVSDSQKEGEEREWSKLTGSNKTVSGTAG